jgi:hypothetical protein
MSVRKNRKENQRKTFGCGMIRHGTVMIACIINMQWKQ